MSRPSFMGAAAACSALAGTSVAVFNMSVWESDKYYFSRAGDASSSVLSFYLALSISIFLLLLGFFLSYKVLRRASPLAPNPSLLGIIGRTLSDAKLARVALWASLLYGFLYAFASSVIVFQPTVDFAKAYATTGILSWSAVPCCGDFGTVPALFVYMSPAHLALQLVPLSALLLFVVPPLVGLNIAIATLSVRRTVARATGRWMVACGAAVGLFTACPTCAGFFLAESVGGLGATTLAVALAPYQAVFIGVSVPLLVLMPFFFAARLRRAGLSVPRTSLSQTMEPGEDRSLAAGNR